MKSKTIAYLRKLARPLKRLRNSLRESFFTALKREFDPVWYRQNYHETGMSRSPLDHYLHEGIRAGHSPNRWFDEAFYTSFYPDVRDGIATGQFLNGFHHYLLHGRAEYRLTKFDLQKALEARMPGVTQATEMWLVDALHRRLKPISAIKSTRRTKVLWFLLPTLNPDIMFGGYRSVLELIKYLRRRNAEVRILICEDERGNLDYFKYHYSDSDLGTAFANISVLNRWRLRAPLEIGVNDRVYAYSAWEAHLAHGLASLTNEPRFVFLVQEYESVFHNFGSEHAIVSGAYRLPHFPIFNSDGLRQFFEQSRLGLFANDVSDFSGARYAVIEHVVSRVLPPDRKRMIAKNGVRRLVMYARPERHAARNLFALGVLGLRHAIERGIIKGDWEMIGVGALSEGHIVYLPERYELYLQARMSSDKFAALLTGTDLGISLMYAPHPGLLTYELAKAGARVVTNTFGNRDAKYFRQISENIIPCDATIDGIVLGLQEAVAGLNDIESRLRGTKIGGPVSWGEVFNERFFAQLSEFC
jgi:hypothetical protein